MHVENKTIINHGNGKTITIEVVPDEVYAKLKRDIKVLGQINDNLMKIIQIRNNQIAKAEEKHAAEMKALQIKFDACFDDYKQYYRLFNEAKEAMKQEERRHREQSQIDHLDHLELLAWRKTEKARQLNASKLRSRIHKARRQAKLKRLLTVRENYMNATEAEQKCNIVPLPGEIATAIIALAEYLKPYNPCEEIQTYLWDCGTVERLTRDVRAGIVRTAFGVDWENRMLAGLVGLGIMLPDALAMIIH